MKKIYSKPVMEKKLEMRIGEEVVEAATGKIVCKQCSSCHGCR